MGTDARVRYTKMVLKEALFKCLKEKSIKDITVTEVCELAEVNRTTFYKHYKDCYDIVRQLEREQLDEFRTLLQSRDKFGEELTGDILNMLDRNKELNETARSGMLSDNFRLEMTEIAKKYALNDWRKMMPKASQQEAELALTVMISASLQVVINEANKFDRDVVIRFITNMINGCVKMYE